MKERFLGDFNSENQEWPFFNLSFAELEKTAQEIQRLAEITFGLTENGMANARGDVIQVIRSGGIFKITQISPSLPDVHAYLTTHPASILIKGSEDRAEMMSALKMMLEELGKRVIE